MFSGIIEETSQILRSNKSDKGILLAFERPKEWTDLKLGESISTNGVCLTIAALREHEYDCFLIPETLDKSTFGVSIPKVVNLERALQINDRIDGHIVQGHVDARAKIIQISSKNDKRISIQIEKSDRKYIISKGSITIDGVALTVASCTDASFDVAVIPYTLEYTILKILEVGDYVNLEFDLIGKYVLNSVKYGDV